MPDTSVISLSNNIETLLFYFLENIQRQNSPFLHM